MAEDPPSEDSGGRGQPPGVRRPSSESASEIDSSRVLSENVWNRPIILDLSRRPEDGTLGVEDTRLYFSSSVRRSWRNCVEPPHELLEADDAFEAEEDGGRSIEISVELFWNVDRVTGLSDGFSNVWLVSGGS